MRDAETVQSSKEVSSTVENVEEDGENADGAASRNVASKRGCSWVYSCCIVSS